MQYLEHTKIFDILTKHKLVGYFRYVDDILILCKETTTNIQEILDMFNNISRTLTFTMETENNHQINFLDITTQKIDHEINFNIYRKPTTTDTIIPYDSCHPPQQEFAAIRYLVYRFTNYPISTINKEKENRTIQQILHRNKFQTYHLDNIVPKMNAKSLTQQADEIRVHDTCKPSKWATFT